MIDKEICRKCYDAIGWEYFDTLWRTGILICPAVKASSGCMNGDLDLKKGQLPPGCKYALEQIYKQEDVNGY